MRQLAAKAREGTLSSREQIEIDNYERVGHFLNLMQSKARCSLKAGRGTNNVVEGSPGRVEGIKAHLERGRQSAIAALEQVIDQHAGQQKYRDVGNFDLPDRSIAGDTFLAGTVGRLHGRWVFLEMTAGRAFPLSVDTYFFP